jgi:hypothetical protein
MGSGERMLFPLPAPDNFPQEDLWDWICESSMT